MSDADGARPVPAPWWSGPERLHPAAAGAPFDLVLLDRDGTLNERVVGGYVTAPEDLHLLPGAADAVARVTRSGARAVLVTNQRGVARGAMTRGDLDAVHDRLRRELAGAGGVLDAVAVCPHEEGACRCRKPATGLLEAALAHAPWADPTRCVVVGDMPSDVAPGRALGMRTRQLRPGEDVGAVVARLLGPRDRTGTDRDPG